MKTKVQNDHYSVVRLPEIITALYDGGRNNFAFDGLLVEI